MGGANKVRRSGCDDQSVQAGERSEGDRGGKAGKTERLSEMSSVYGKCGLCGAGESSGKAEPPHYPGDDPGQQMGIPVFALCVL